MWNSWTNSCLAGLCSNTHKQTHCTNTCWQWLVILWKSPKLPSKNNRKVFVVVEPCSSRDLVSESEDNVSVFLVLQIWISPSYFSVSEDLYTLCVVVMCIKSNSVKSSCFTFFLSHIFCLSGWSINLKQETLHTNSLWNDLHVPNHYQSILLLYNSNIVQCIINSDYSPHLSRCFSCINSVWS